MRGVLLFQYCALKMLKAMRNLNGMEVVFKLNFTNKNESNQWFESMIPTFISKHFIMLNILEMLREVETRFKLSKSCRNLVDYLTKNNSLCRMYHWQTFFHIFTFFILFSLQLIVRVIVLIVIYVIKRAVFLRPSVRHTLQ